MSEVGAVGDLVSGTMIARALEPKAGEVGADGHTTERKCLNCETVLTGEFCHGCGQRAHVHRTLSAFFHDVAHGVLHFEGKIWRTLPLLAWRPGELTRRYIDGERAKFVSPMALFLFSVFLMFAVVSATGNLNPNFSTKEDLAKAEQNATAELKELEAKRATAVAANRPTAEIDSDIKNSRAELHVIRTMRSQGITSAVLTSPDATINTDVPAFAEAYKKAKENPQLLIYKLKSNSYKWSWTLIPLSVPFLWLLFPFSRRFRLYDHVVFVTYSLAFMSLLVVIGSATSYAGFSAIAAPLLFIPPIHMYRQLRGAYALGRWGAIWRTAALLVVSLIVLIIFILGMVALGVLD